MQEMTVEKKGTALEFRYPIIWDTDFDALPDKIREAGLNPKRICVITDSNVKNYYLDEVLNVLRNFWETVESYVIPAGEEHKNLQEISSVYQFLMEHQFDRRDMIAALGGGVVGDMSGFAAATYLRGIDYIQIPTTLLAQVDSSVGGKTGVDFEGYKNMVGAFWQPRLVYMNMSTLKTLPDRQFTSGMGEVIKSSLIRDRDLFDWIERHAKEINRKEPEALTHMVHSCCRIKAAVVEEDPRDTGLRAILNFGHTIGHAVEKLSSFRLPHGHSVGIGMIAASYISMKRGMIREDEYERIRRVNEMFSIPQEVEQSSFTSKDVFDATRKDKKMEGGKIKFILLDGLGNAVIDTEVSDAELSEAVDVILPEPDVS